MSLKIFLISALSFVFLKVHTAQAVGGSLHNKSTQAWLEKIKLLKTTDQYDSMLTQLDGEISQNQNDIENVNDRIKNLESSLLQAHAGVGRGQIGKKELSASDIELNSKIKKTMSDLKKSINDKEKILEDLKNNKKTTLDAKSDLIKVNALDNHINATQNSILSAKIKTLDGDRIIDKIEQKIESSKTDPTAVYVKDKIGKLVNSKLICEAYQRCKAPNEKKIPIPPEELNEVFPDTGIATRTEYYYQMRNKSEKSETPAASK